MLRTWGRFVICGLAVSTALAACSRAERAPPATYVTEYGLGPDKWAAAWLLTRHVTPGARLVVVPQGEPLTEGIPFDQPASQYRRQGELSTFEVVRTAAALKDPVVETLGKVVQDIEVFFWMEPTQPHADLVEDSFRALQLRYGRDAVPAECYLAFFDKVHALLAAQAQPGAAAADPSALEVDCAQASAAAATARAALVPEVPLRELLDAMGRGEDVVFVDVREPEEFAESHIPGALNLVQRDVDGADLERLRRADRVIAYCVKDFRGFEMAKALRDRGVKGAAILNPFGIKGWMSAQLPVAGANALSEADGARALAHCVAAGPPCKTPPPQAPGGGR